MFSHQLQFLIIHGALLTVIVFASLLMGEAGYVRDFFGGMVVGLVPNTVFALIIFSLGATNDNRASPAIPLLAEAVKLLLAFMGFAFLFGLFGVSNPLAVFAGFILIFIIQTSSAFFYCRRAFGLGHVD